MMRKTLTMILVCIASCTIIAGCGSSASSSDSGTSEKVKELSDEVQELSEKVQELSDEVRKPSDEAQEVSEETKETSEDLEDHSLEQESAVTVEITKEMQKKLNTFLSNFAEQNMEKFDYGHPLPAELAEFAYRWTYINKNNEIGITTDGYYTIGLDKVKSIVNRYMDVTLTDEDLYSGDWSGEYQGFVRDDKYFVPAADGETFTTFAVVTSLTEESADNYKAQFDVYDVDIDYYYEQEDWDSIPGKYYPYSAAEAESDTNLIKRGSGYAIIKKDGDSYKLRYYEF